MDTVESSVPCIHRYGTGPITVGLEGYYLLTISATCSGVMNNSRALYRPPFCNYCAIGKGVHSQEGNLVPAYA